MPRRFLKYIYIALAAHAIIMLLLFFLPPLSALTHSVINIFPLVSFLIGFIIVFVVLTRIYFKYRRQLSYIKSLITTIWFTLFLSVLPISIFSFIPILVTGGSLVSPNYMGLFGLVFPVSFAYLIVTKQLYDIDIVLRRILFAIIISIIPSAVITAIEALIYLRDLSPSLLILNFSLVLVASTTIVYSLEYLTQKLEKTIFPRKYHLQSALKKISRDLVSTQSFRELKNIVLVDIVSTMQVHGAAIVFRSRSDVEIIDEGKIDKVKVKQLVTDMLNEHYYNFYEINRHEEYTSYLVITPKQSGTAISKEEEQWLALIISYLSVSLDNLYLIRKLTTQMQERAAQYPNEAQSNDIMWFRKSMFELQENERVRIAADLHDTTMQDVFFVQRKLASFIRRLDNPQDRSQLTDIINHLDLINVNLRQCCFELNPSLIEHKGFLSAVHNLIENEKHLSEFEIEWLTDGNELIEQCTLDMKKHLFRIVQELLNNAKKHSQATKVTIRFRIIQSTLYLEYRDNGIGFTQKKSIRKHITQTGIGLEQMRSRVLHINGEFKIVTGQSRGVKVRIKVPLLLEITA